MAALTADELTALLVRRLRINPVAVSQEVIANFCDVTRLTVAGWFADRKPLGGLCTLKLWYLLEAARVDSPELTAARNEYPLGEYIGRLLAFDVLKMGEARELCNVKDNAIFRAARTEGRLSRPSKTLRELREEYGESLKLAEDSLRQVLKPDQTTEGEIPKVVVEASSRVDVRQQLVLQVAQNLMTAVASANLAVEDFSPAERAALRTLMGADGMFRFANVLSRLCGERAFAREGN